MTGLVLQAGTCDNGDERLLKVGKCLRASSYEPGRRGWPGYRDLSFCDQDLGNQAGNFSHMNTPAWIPGLSRMKHFQLHMACKVADKSERNSTGILGAFWTSFISVTGIKFPI